MSVNSWASGLDATRGPPSRVRFGTGESVTGLSDKVGVSLPEGVAVHVSLTGLSDGLPVSLTRLSDAVGVALALTGLADGAGATVRVMDASVDEGRPSSSLVCV